MRKFTSLLLALLLCFGTSVSAVHANEYEENSDGITVTMIESKDESERISVTGNLGTVRYDYLRGAKQMSWSMNLSPQVASIGAAFHIKDTITKKTKSYPIYTKSGNITIKGVKGRQYDCTLIGGGYDSMGHRIGEICTNYYSFTY